MRGSMAALGIVAWELAVRLLAVPDYLLPPPSGVAEELIARFALVARHAGVTLGEVGVGLAAAVGGGAILAVAMASMPFLQRALYPLLAFLQAVPKVTVAPLFLIWLGPWPRIKGVVGFSIGFFPLRREPPHDV